MAPNTHGSLFLICHFAHTYMHNSKATGCIRMFYISNDYSDQRCLFSGSELHARYNWQVMASNTHGSLFPIRHFVCTYTHNLKTTGCIWTFCISNDCSTIRDILCVIYSYMRDLTGELWPQTHIDCSLIQHCVCLLQAVSYIAIWCATMHDNSRSLQLY